MHQPANFSARLLFAFTEATDSDSWGVQDDVVMGGRSASNFEITQDGKGRFYGHVSLENNGGFASIVHTLEPDVELQQAESFQLLVRGDGNTYTFRVKDNEEHDYYFQADFPTKANEKWETISIPFSSMSAVHHGEPVDVPNYDGNGAVRFQLLIGNKKEQNFEILLATIEAI